jgi:hypothetical protein
MNERSDLVSYDVRIATGGGVNDVNGKNLTEGVTPETLLGACAVVCPAIRIPRRA